VSEPFNTTVQSLRRSLPCHEIPVSSVSRNIAHHSWYYMTLKNMERMRRLVSHGIPRAIIVKRWMHNYKETTFQFLYY
jgi:hypothetical protein